MLVWINVYNVSFLTCNMLSVCGYVTICVFVFIYLIRNSVSAGRVYSSIFSTLNHIGLPERWKENKKQEENHRRKK